MIAGSSAIAEAFGMPDTPTLTRRTLNKSLAWFTEIRNDARDFGMSAAMPYDDAYLVTMQIAPCHDHDLYFEGMRVRPSNYHAGAIALYDMRRIPVADPRDPFHSVHLRLPRAMFDELTGEYGVPGIGDLRYELAAAFPEPVARHLLSALLPAVAPDGGEHLVPRSMSRSRWPATSSRPTAACVSIGVVPTAAWRRGRSAASCS